MTKNTITFTIHKYAPELSRVYYRQSDITNRLSGLDKSKLGVMHNDLRIAYIRDLMRGPSGLGPVRSVTLQFRHSVPDHKFCDRSYIGRYLDSKILLSFIRRLQKKHNLPDCRLSINFKKWSVTQ